MRTDCSSAPGNSLRSFSTAADSESVGAGSLPALGASTLESVPNRARTTSRARPRLAQAPFREVRARGKDDNFMPSSPLFLRSEEHTSELQSRFDLVCRLLLEKKKTSTN